MVLVGVGAVMAVGRLGHRAALPGLGPSARHRGHAGHGGQRPADHAGRAAERAAGRGRGGRALHGRAAGDHHATARCCSSASPWPRAASSPRPPTSWAACSASSWSAPAASSSRPRWSPRTRRPTSRWSTCPRTSRSRPSPTTPPRQRRPRHGPHLRAGGRRRHRAALHPRCGHRRRGAPSPAGPPRPCRPSPRRPPRRRSSPASRCSTPPAPWSGSSTTPTRAPSPATFLPSDLVVGVADDLRSQNRVVHGWLGVQGTDAPDGAGATVAQVQSGGPASGRLQVGQLITAVNATPVRTMAELRARLYVLPPGTAVTLSVAAAGRDQGRGRHPRHVLLACEGEHVRFQRPRQSDGGPPRRPDEGHRLGARARPTAGSRPPAPWPSGWPPTAGEDENPDPLVRIAFEELARVAELHVVEATGIGPASGAGGVSFEAVGPGQWSFRVLEAYRPVLKSMVEAQQQGAAAVPSSLDLSELDPDVVGRPQRPARAVRPHARPGLPRHAVRLGRGAPGPPRLRAVRPAAALARVVDPPARAGQRGPLRRGLEPAAPRGPALGLPARAHHARRADPARRARRRS